jgi:uncharacterized protein
MGSHNIGYSIHFSHFHRLFGGQIDQSNFVPDPSRRQGQVDVWGDEPLPRALSQVNQQLRAHPTSKRKKTCAALLRGNNHDMASVTILGASNDPVKFGNKAVRAFQQQGYTVYPVNPKETVIENLPVFKSILDVPTRPDLVSVYLPPPILLKNLRDIAARGCNELWLNPGTESEEVLVQARKLRIKVIQGCSIVGIGVSPGSL